MLFERLLVHDDPARADAATNMAIDEALLEFTDAPTLRFYGWKRPALSFGYFGKFGEAEAAGAARELVRRWTGGGSVLHGDDLTYSLIVPAAHRAVAFEPGAIYAAVHEAIRDALCTLGIRAELAPASRAKISDACFANPVRHDLLLAERKIAGAAQRRTRRGFLHQGSIQLGDLPATFRECFARALAEKFESREISAELRDRAALLADEKYRTQTWLRRR